MPKVRYERILEHIDEQERYHGKPMFMDCCTQSGLGYTTMKETELWAVWDHETGSEIGVTPEQFRIMTRSAVDELGQAVGRT